MTTRRTSTRLTNSKRLNLFWVYKQNLTHKDKRGKKPARAARPRTLRAGFSAAQGCNEQVPNSPERQKKKDAMKRRKGLSLIISLFTPNRKTRAESHAIDATRHLYTLQYPVWNLSRLQMIHGSSNLALLCAPRECVWSWPEGYRNFNR